MRKLLDRLVEIYYRDGSIAPPRLLDLLREMVDRLELVERALNRLTKVGEQEHGSQKGLQD